jgi:F420H(2)-dependent quinone reductase
VVNPRRAGAAHHHTGPPDRRAGWFQNLRAADVADVQIRADSFRVRPRELVGAARETAWRETILAQAPEVEKYARKAGRTIPVAVLEPLARPDA